MDYLLIREIKSDVHETFLNGTKNSWVTKHFSGSKDGGSIIDYLTSQRMLGNYGISNL